MLKTCTGQTKERYSRRAWMKTIHIVPLHVRIVNSIQNSIIMVQNIANCEKAVIFICEAWVCS